MSRKELFDCIRLFAPEQSFSQEQVNLIDALADGLGFPREEGEPDRITDAQLIEDLKRDEGLRLNAYPDPLSGGDPWTIGYGATGKDIRKGVVWTDAQAEQRLIEMAEDHARRFEERAPWAAKLDPVRRRVLHNMAYNLGVEGLLGFKNTLGFVQTGQYGRAADGMLASKWARQVGQRAVRLAQQMRTGK
ncbi:glycoside hydrolase family protein [Brevundimonas sp. Root1279]|uniref:glycoside hydrolase family protein n=1 Tax=Brevundimonas sp. Root1279 TaxID=1736443 RepID=UPI0006FE852B|nr:glycoside hydrolase family protein [Brevundimonas sp. Root1279]KQW79698.1 hypothetical protein ASC65_14210 [Brevundimonas sp. Root1279]